MSAMAVLPQPAGSVMGGTASTCARLSQPSSADLLGPLHLAGFQFQSGEQPGAPDSFVLDGMGPKLLTSDVSTAGGRTLRWSVLSVFSVSALS